MYLPGTWLINVFTRNLIGQCIYQEPDWSVYLPGTWLVKCIYQESDWWMYLPEIWLVNIFTRNLIGQCIYQEPDWSGVSLEDFMSCEHNMANNRQARMLADIGNEYYSTSFEHFISLDLCCFVLPFLWLEIRKHKHFFHNRIRIKSA